MNPNKSWEKVDKNELWNETSGKNKRAIKVVISGNIFERPLYEVFSPPVNSTRSTVTQSKSTPVGGNDDLYSF